MEIEIPADCRLETVIRHDPREDVVGEQAAR
jgi:hypothetical protein